MRPLRPALVLLLAAACLPAGAKVAGSPHDLRAPGSRSVQDACASCHLAHGAGPEQREDTAWGQTASTSTFALYYSSSFDGEQDAASPGAISLDCLGCHDGTVASDHAGRFADSPASPQQVVILGSATHPIAFRYDTDLAKRDGGLADPDSTPSGLGGTIATDLLVDGRMECTSCHAVHDDGEAGLLVKSNARSALCLTCHLK